MRTVAIDLGGTAVKLGVFDVRPARRDRRVRHRGRADRPRRGRRAGRSAPRRRAAPTRVGIAVPGIVDSEGSSLLAAHGKYARAARPRPLARGRVDRFGCPAVVENDARAALIGEVTDGSARGARDAVLIVLGTGIGTAALLDGSVVRGAPRTWRDPRRPHHRRPRRATLPLRQHRLRRGAREHVGAGGGCRVRRPRPRPRARRAGSRTRGTIGIRDLVETRDEPESAAILDRYIRTWAAVIVTQCHAFDPEVVVVTGGVMRAADVILPALRDRVHADLWSSSFRPPFVTPDDPSTSVLRGLAALAHDLDSKGRP